MYIFKKSKCRGARLVLLVGSLSLSFHLHIIIYIWKKMCVCVHHIIPRFYSLSLTISLIRNTVI